MPPVYIIGVGADGLASVRPRLTDIIQGADFLAGGERLLRFVDSRGTGVAPFRQKRFIIKDNLDELAAQLANRRETERCVVLASGDPLFYGAGTFIMRLLGADNVRVEPAVSSMQLAFARAGIPWHHAALASIHGRDLRKVLLPLLGRELIGLFTQDGDSPAAVARFFLQFGLNGYEAVVGENLGADDERVSRYPDLQHLANERFAPLNYLILSRQHHAVSPSEIERNRALVPGVPDQVFARPGEGQEVMTRQEVRSVLLGKLGPTETGDTIWDIGAGLGTVSVELAVLRRDVEIVAVECNPTRVSFLQQNRERFDANNIRIVAGTAPEVLLNETERPRIVFIGGSKEHLPAILDLAHDRLLKGGRLLGNFVTLENLSLVLEKLRLWRWPFDVTEIQVARSDNLAGLTGLRPLRGVFLVCGTKPGAGHE
jgi:precorrin-6Y C5,15-methyltransferase (decarboxylating)